MTRIEFGDALKKIQAELEKQAEDEVRKRWREEHGVIYVREYTVKAHLRPMRPKRARRRAVATARIRPVTDVVKAVLAR